MSISADDPRYVFMPETEVLAAKGYTQVLRDKWWSVHPEHGLRFWQSNMRRKGQLVGASPQCNSDERITRRLCVSGDEVRQIPIVLAPINPSDYER